MSLDNNLIILYPELTTENFDPITGDIYLKDDGDGDVYIAKWEYAQSLPEGALVGKEYAQTTADAVAAAVAAALAAQTPATTAEPLVEEPTVTE